MENDRANFGDIDRWADAYANALHAWGIRRGDAVLVVAEMSIELIQIHFAVARMGAIFIPANPRFSESELLQIVRYLGAGKIVVDDRNQDMVGAIARVVGADVGVLAPGCAAVCGVNLRSAAAVAFGAAYAGPPARPDDTHAIFLTSGSSGTPKGVEISHRANWLRAHLNQRLNSSLGVACMFPLHHMAGWQMLAQAWAVRRPIHFVSRPNASNLLDAMTRWQASSFYAIPAVWRKLLAHGRVAGPAHLRAVETGTSFVEPGLLLALRERFPQAALGVGYGSTEIGSGMWLANEDVLHKPCSVGLPTSGVAARIEDGELLIKADTLMNGYYKLPAETAACLQDGWYRTGDLARQDGDGYFSIAGRRGEVIRSAGETIVPAEVEAPLTGIDGVKEIAIFGLPDRDWGEIVCAAVVYAPGGSPISVGALRSRLRNFANYKHPRRIVEVDEIPRTAATGQVQRGQLRAVIVEMLESRRHLAQTESVASEG